LIVQGDVVPWEWSREHPDERPVGSARSTVSRQREAHGGIGPQAGVFVGGTEDRPAHLGAVLVVVVAVEDAAEVGLVDRAVDADPALGHDGAQRGERLVDIVEAAPVLGSWRARRLGG
jgi:hypothetical protein